MKAKSIWISPHSMARTRPPWERIMAGFFSFPRDIASPMAPRTPLEEIPVMVPSYMYLTSEVWAAPREEAHMVMSLIPRAAIASTAMQST